MHGLEPTSKLIIEEAQRRGIAVEILAPRAEYFRLRHSGRMLLCRESLSELATGVAVSRCDDQHITWRILQAAGLPVPAQMEAASEEQNTSFLREHDCVLVKPMRRGHADLCTPNVVREAQLSEAVTRAAAAGSGVLIEQQVEGLALHVVHQPATVVNLHVDQALSVEVAVRVLPRLDPQPHHTWRRAQRSRLVGGSYARWGGAAGRRDQERVTTGRQRRSGTAARSRH